MHSLLLKEKSIGKLKGVLFDKDGTLSNSEIYLNKLAKLRVKEAINIYKKNAASKYIIEELKKTLEKAYGITIKGINPTGTIAVGSKQQNLISTATIISLFEGNWPKAFSIANQVFQQVDKSIKEKGITDNERPILPGAIDFLENLKNAKIKCALISNDSISGIKEFLKINDLESSMPINWSAENQPSKPNPDAVGCLCTKLGLKPSECALIGDADSDLAMARQAGISIIIGYDAGWSTRPKLSAQDYLIHHWNELSIELNTKIEQSQNK